MDIVSCVPHMACLCHVRQRMTCLLDLAVKTVGCRLRARLHKCVVTWCFLCGSQRVGKKSTNCACLMSRSVCGRCLRTTSTQISSKVVHVMLLRSLPAQAFSLTYSCSEVKVLTFTAGTFNIIRLGSLC